MITTIRRFFISSLLVFLVCYISPQRIMEIITILAVIVALFRDKLYYFFFSPNLVITASRGPSHFGIAPLIDQVTWNVQDNLAYFGVVVENHGIGIAKDVEVVFNGLNSNRVANFGRYKTLTLKRSWIHDAIVSNLHNGVPIRFDICSIIESSPNRLNFGFIRTPNELINIPCEAPEESFFEFEVVALSKNAPLARKTVRITYNGNYLEGFDVNEI